MCIALLLQQCRVVVVYSNAQCCVVVLCLFAVCDTCLPCVAVEVELRNWNSICDVFKDGGIVVRSVTEAEGYQRPGTQHTALPTGT